MNLPVSTDIQRLEPIFDFASDKSSFIIHQSNAEVCIDDNKYSGEGEIRLDLLPRANIRAYGYFKGVPIQDAMGSMIGQKQISSFSINGRAIEGFRLSCGGDADKQEYNMRWCPKSEPVIGVGNDLTQMRRIVFHLFNFMDIVGTRHSIEKTEKNMHAIQHLDLSSDEWKIELKSLRSTDESIKFLKEEGGYRLTHIGNIQRSDDSPISGSDARECLYALRFFLSFVKGGWCEPICAVGFDPSGSRAWEYWSSPREPWHQPLSWFDPHNGSQMAALFPGFMKKWINDDWREAIHEVIYWYLNANNSSRGIDAGIILAQAALERLSYEFAVKDRRLVTVDGFKSLRASDRIRLLFSSLNIPLDIPTESPELQKLACKGQMNWLDAPHALTEIRNSLVHPEHKKRGQLGTVYSETWNLGLWYLEMGLLAICGYTGTYSNRLKQRFVGDVEDVPWKI